MNKLKQQIEKVDKKFTNPNKKELMEVLQHNPTFLEIRNKYNAEKNTFYFQLSADKHIDNPESDIKLAKKHLDELKELGGLAFDFGDQFDVMQGKNDRRGNKSDLKGELKEGNYLDKAVDYNADFRGPYAENIALLSQGNHETAIIKHNETNLIERLVKELNYRHGTKITSGLYAGWVKFTFEHTGGGNIKTVLLHYDHGYGGGGPVTKGVIQSNRRATYLPQPDVVVSGHIHESWVLELVQEMVDQKGESYLRTQSHVSLPTYKEEYLKGQGWHRERGGPPKPIGALLMKIVIDPHGRPKITFIRQT